MMKIYDYQYFRNVILHRTPKLEELLTCKKALYETFEIPKKGGMREIHTLTKSGEGRKLMQAQKNLYQNFLCKLPIATPAHGFVKGKNYQTFLEPHLGNRFFMRLDIENFFSSFSVFMMEDILQEYIENEEALLAVIALCTLDDKLPQGVCTSPVLSNILFRRIDQRILKYCQTIEEGRRRSRGPEDETAEKRIVCYTRYADDMLFSSDQFDFEKNLNFLRMIRRILKENGFQINTYKTVMGSEKIALNGYILDDKLHLSRKKLQNIRRILYFFRDKNTEEYSIEESLFPKVTAVDKDMAIQKLLQKLNALDLQEHAEKKNFTSISGLIQYLCGYRSWLIAVLQTGEGARSVDRKIPRFIRHIEILLKKLEKYES